MTKSEQRISQIDELIFQHEKAIAWLQEQRREEINRSGANKGGGDAGIHSARNK